MHNSELQNFLRKGFELHLAFFFVRSNYAGIGSPTCARCPCEFCSFGGVEKQLCSHHGNMRGGGVRRHERAEGV